MRIALVLSLATCLLSSVVAADEESEEVAERFYARSKQATEQKIKGMTLAIPDLENDLRNAKRGVINKQADKTRKNNPGGYIYPNADARRVRISELEALIETTKKQITDAKAGKIIFWADFPQPLAVGNAGKVDFVLELVQKVNDKSARVSIAGETCFLDGIDLSNVADESDFKLDEYLEVIGTRTYKTVQGAPRTEFVVRPFDLKRAEAIRAKDNR